jgi:hypothetical protein
MNFDETLYAEFAATVEFILEKALEGAARVPRPQAIQHSAKSAASLKEVVIVAEFGMTSPATPTRTVKSNPQASLSSLSRF